MHRGAKRAGALAVDDADRGQIGKIRVVQEHAQNALHLVGGHAADIQLRAGRLHAQFPLTGIDDLFHALVRLLLQKVDLLRLGVDLEDSGLELVGAVLVDGKHRGLGAQL